MYIIVKHVYIYIYIYIYIYVGMYVENICLWGKCTCVWKLHKSNSSMSPQP